MFQYRNSGSNVAYINILLAYLWTNYQCQVYIDSHLPENTDNKESDNNSSNSAHIIFYIMTKWNKNVTLAKCNYSILRRNVLSSRSRLHTCVWTKCISFKFKNLLENNKLKAHIINSRKESCFHTKKTICETSWTL